MDVNGTRFHLLKGRDDWLRCRPASPADGAEWNDVAQSLTLRPVTPRFKGARHGGAFGPEARRGAARDRFGNFYWIASDRQRLFWLPSGEQAPALFWDSIEAAPTHEPGEFRPLDRIASEPVRLTGMAATDDHYLVVGDSGRRGLLLFDLFSGGSPSRLLFPASVDFEPFDLDAAPGGGVFILDRVHRRYWRLDRSFRILSAAGAGSETRQDARGRFRPLLAEAAPSNPGIPFPRGFPLAAIDPIAIAGLADGGVLVLSNPQDLAAGTSTISIYRMDRPLTPVIELPPLETLASTGGAADTDDARTTLLGQDLVALEKSGGELLIRVVDWAGSQTFAFVLDREATPLRIRLQRDYLPMSYYGGRGLIAVGEAVYYDVSPKGRDTATRWVSLRPVDQYRYKTKVVIDIPTLDGKERDCAWHRLFLDACIPPDTSVKVWTRAHDDKKQLAAETFAAEPDLYLRGSGSEVPFHTPFAEETAPAPGRGTWELLIQKARGRWLQVRIELAGNGHASPQLRALRVYYPRFSYTERYLPGAYRIQDAEPNPEIGGGPPASFLERLLANMEGIFTEIEGRIAGAGALLDPRSAPPDTLDWLASWLGLTLDPLWGSLQESNGQDRRRLLIQFAHKLFERRGTAEGIRFALLLFLDPCLERRLQRFRRAALEPDAWLASELQRLRLPYPDSALDEQSMEDAFFDYLVSPRRQFEIRIVEHFLIRGGRALVEGHPAAAGTTVAAKEDPDALAHGFSVLTPADLSSADLGMVRRIVELEKPAHTRFDIVPYFSLFRVGTARLGLDTTPGADARFVPQRLGNSELATGYLPAAYPMNVRERMIADRDRVGTLPPL